MSCFCIVSNKKYVSVSANYLKNKQIDNSFKGFVHSKRGREKAHLIRASCQASKAHSQALEAWSVAVKVHPGIVRSHPGAVENL